VQVRGFGLDLQFEQLVNMYFAQIARTRRIIRS